MSKEGEAAYGWPCCLKNESTLLADGVDSKVYRSGDIVIKDYEVVPGPKRMNSLTKETLFDYYRATNLAQKLVETEKMSLHLRSSNMDIPLKINPFLDLHNCEVCGGFEGIAEYIPGKTLYEVRGRADVCELESLLTDLSIKIENKLGFYGINIVLLNVKVTGFGGLIVTDLCADICKLHRL